MKPYLIGYRCEHYNGQRSKLFASKWRADFTAWWRGEGWYVRPVQLLAPAVGGGL